MDKYFTIKPNSRLYNDYFQYLKDVENNAALFDKFAEEYGIETSKFIPDKLRLCIVPSEKDKDVFRNEFTQDWIDGCARQFKVRSKIGKAWVSAMSDIRYARKPTYFCFVDLCGRFRERMFHIGVTLYGSISADCDFKLHECMSEIKASEFYKIIEDYNSSISKEG